MNRNVFLGAVSGLMALSLALAACTTPAAPEAPRPVAPAPAPAASETPSAPVSQPPQQEPVKPSAEAAPKYGGVLTLAIAQPITTWDPTRLITGAVPGLYLNSLWEGDWEKGSAGGHGTKETDWGFGNNDIFSLKMGYIAESWNWYADAAKQEGTIVYQIRPGVRWSLNRNFEASRLVNGREVTADDIVFSLTRATTYDLAFVYNVNTELRKTPVTKTGPSEVTVKVPYDALYNAVTRFGDAVFIVPPEVVKKYGDLSDWKNQVGTGPFILAENVPDSGVTFVKNPSYWMKDPVGPGKGNQLPYIDTVRVLTLTDASTRLAALRTGKVDQMVPVTYDDASTIRKTATGIKEIVSSHWQGRGTPIFLRTDTAPFTDVRVRRAVNMAIDRETINKTLYGGQGDAFPFPFAYVKEYDAMYYKPADWTPLMKEIYTYNPEKAKQLLQEAGYPSGFKADLLITSTEVDYNAIVKDMLSKIGVEVSFMIKETNVVNSMQLSWTHPAMTTVTTGPVAVFMVGNSFSGKRFNLSILNDSVINEALKKTRTAAITDLHQAMVEYREMTKYALEQAYHIPNVAGPVSLFYWPWIKNYSGEITVGYDDMTWPQWVWIDKALKKSMGY